MQINLQERMLTMLVLPIVGAVTVLVLAMLAACCRLPRAERGLCAVALRPEVCTLQLWIVLRNSGTNDALLSKLGSQTGWSWLLALLSGVDHVSNFREADPLRDPLYRLQYLARLAVQYDLADVSAMLATWVCAAPRQNPLVVLFWATGLQASRRLPESSGPAFGAFTSLATWWKVKLTPPGAKSSAIAGSWYLSQPSTLPLQNTAVR